MPMCKPKVLIIIPPYVVESIDVNKSKVRSFAAHPYGPLSMANYNRHLAEWKIVDFNTKRYVYREHVLWEILEDFKPDIVGISMMFDGSYKYLEQTADTVKKYLPNALVILGGAAASYSYEEILENVPDIDAICYSEGELPMERLLGKMRDYPSAQPYELLYDDSSWITRDSLKLRIKPHISFIEDLNTVINIDYSLINPDVYGMMQAFSPHVDYSKPHKQFFIITSRGCPFSCSFCSNAKIHGKKMRMASVDALINHVDYLVREYDMDVLTIYDDQLLIDQNRAKELFRRLIPYNLRIEMPNGLSPAFIDKELAVLMAGAGVDTVYLAIESGSPFVLQHIIHKPLKLSMVRPVVDMLHEEGIFCHGFFVCGMPGETNDDREATWQFILDADLDWAGINPATPVRGSKLYDQCIKNGWITKQRVDQTEDKKYIINAPKIGLGPDAIMEQINEINLDVNFTHNRAMRVGDYKTAAKCFEEVLRRYGQHNAAIWYLEICRLREGKQDGSNKANTGV